MSNVLNRHLMLLVVACLIPNPGAVWAQSAEPAGRFVNVVGDVGIVDRNGAQRNAARGSEFREGETILTGPEALAQLRMADGALLTVRGNTEIKLDRFTYGGKEDRNASFLMSILKGGMRTITGFIARVNRSGYAIRTPSATLGVRGTHFEVVHILQAVSQEAPAGTYNRVYEGITTMQNAAGSLQVIRDQTGFAALQGTAPPVLVAPPAAIFGRPTPVPRANFQSPIETPRAVSPVGPTTTISPSPISPTLTSPTPTIQTAPNTTVQTAPGTTIPIQTAPILQSAPAPIQTGPTTPIQTAPILQSAPAPINPPKKP